jgi:hypothetical protein
MRTIAFYVLSLNLLIAFIIFLSSCKKCEPYRSSSTMPEEAKAFIPDKKGDTLHFKDFNGKNFLLICNSNSIRPTGYSSTGHNNECDDSYMSWEYLQADYTSNLICDNGEQLNLMLRFGDPPGYDPAFGSDNCSLRTGRSPFYFKFNSSNLAQGAKGFSESNNDPAFRNFAFRSVISLNGKQFQNVNFQSIEHPGPETICQVPKTPALGIDSIYYSVQYGLIRLTTVSGKKYQRVL